MVNKAIAIFTGKSTDTVLTDGGTQSWVMDRANALQHTYVVLCRNAHIEWVEGDEPHGSAFLLGRLLDVVPSTETAGRWKVLLSHYAELRLPDVWQGWRNPVRYTTLEELSIDPSKFAFQPMPQRESAPRVIDGLHRMRGGFQETITLSEAKRLLSATYGVKPEAVEIIIRG